MTVEPIIAAVASVGEDELLDLYSSVGWGAYTRDPVALTNAIANSSYVVTAVAGDQLVGLARGISDDVSIFYLQDILVRPEWQHRGLGTALLTKCLHRYGHVRQKVLLTDDQASQHRFYASMGFADTRSIEAVRLHTFVQIEGV